MVKISTRDKTPFKREQFSKNTLLTSVETMKTPKNRRKSLGSVLLTPNSAKNPTDLNRRKSIAALQPFKIDKIGSRILLDNENLDSLKADKQNSKSEKKKVRDSPAYVTATPKRAKQRNQSTGDGILLKTIQSEKKNKLEKTSSVLSKEKNGSTIVTPKSEKNEEGLFKEIKAASPKKKQKLNLKQQETSDVEIDVKELEHKFNIPSQAVEDAIQGVIKFASNNPHLKNQLFNEEIPLFLQVNSFKIPKTKGTVKQVYRVPLKHSTITSDSDICLIVPDVKGIKNNEHEKHLEHYENILRLKNVTGIKKIMTFHEFRTEYETFELKNRLVDLYDVFLVDGRISGKVVHKCGNIFYKKRKVPLSIKLHVSKLNSLINKALKKAYFHIGFHSDSNMVQFGHSKMDLKELIENVYSVVEFLDKQYPGGMDNIRSLNAFAHRGSSIPIYLSLKNPNDIKVPILKSRKPKAYKSYSGELTTQYNAEVTVRPSGHVIVKRSNDQLLEKEDPDDKITDEEILRENKNIDKIEDQSRKGESMKGKKGEKKRKVSEGEIEESFDGIVGEESVLKKKRKTDEKSQESQKKEIISVPNKKQGKNKKSVKNKQKETTQIEENTGVILNDSTGKKIKQKIKKEKNIKTVTAMNVKSAIDGNEKKIMKTKIKKKSFTS